MVITDQTMPEVTGIEVVKAARRLVADVKIILCTGYSEVAHKDTARKAGAQYFLTKPINPTTLINCIQEVAPNEAMSA